VNVISVGVYAAQGVYALSIEYLILLFMAANGARAWTKIADKNKDVVLTNKEAGV